MSDEPAFKTYPKHSWQPVVAKATIAFQSFIELLFIAAIAVGGLSPSAKIVWVALTLVGWAVGVALVVIGFYANINWEDILDSW